MFLAINYSLRFGWVGHFNIVIPGHAKHEPGIHNPCREYGFPDVQLHI